MLKNLTLTTALVACFGIVLMLRGAPQGSEFVATINSTINQVTQDLPAGSADAVRVHRDDSDEAVEHALNGVAAISMQSTASRPAFVRLSEPDCGGWND